MKIASRWDRARVFPAILLLATTLSSHAASVRYVDVNSLFPAAPYTSWATAARRIQTAVDVAAAGDTVLVASGVYQTGARAVNGMSNRVAVTKPVTVRSVNGPAVTQIKGYQVPGTTNGPAAVRCVYLTNGAVLAGFTLTNGATQTRGTYYSDCGGGVWCEGLSGVVSNCVFVGNSANWLGGGAYHSTLYICSLTGNSTRGHGGGVYYSTLHNCTLVGNSADYGGGAFYATLNNCIIYYNSARTSGANYHGGSLSYCCTTPLPSGPGSLIDEPQLASTSHLGAGSPCIGRGNTTYARGVDVDGETWANPPSIGCDEYWTASATGALSVAVVAVYTNVTVGFPVDLQAAIRGRVSASRWDFGDGLVVSNRPWTSHAFAAVGTYLVELRAYNKSYPAGVAATVTVRVAPPIHYVALDSRNPVPPYVAWDTAAHTIQEAVDASVAGDTVLVTNGIYATSGRAVVGAMTNRLVIDKAITVRSVNGPEATLIVGTPTPGGTNGDGAVRCAFVGANAVLSGFTLTNGHTLFASQRNDELVKGGGAWCDLFGVITNCLITSNSAHGDGAGVHGGTLRNCVLMNNHGSDEDSDGGAADHSMLFNCILTGNSGREGGAADDSTLYNCILNGNKARARGGGATRSDLYNCTVLDNSARQGGGVSECIVYNSIVYHNQAVLGPDYDVETNYRSSFSHSCTTPLPTTGTGNIALDPQMASWTHLSAQSPCVGTGSALYASGLDIDGEMWSDPPCMGADQFVPGSATSPITVLIEGGFTNLTAGFANPFRARIAGQTTASRWAFGDGTLISNHLDVLHAWGAPGAYEVQLTAFNDAYPNGVTAIVAVQVVETPVFYVNLANPTPAFPYTSWSSAAKNIQDAIGASGVAGRLIWVANGVYDTGGVAVFGQMTNRIALTQGVVVRSVNGPEVTILRGAPGAGGANGDGAIRCAYVGAGSLLDGFTLTNGHTRATGHTSREQGGGGAWCDRSGVVTNCVLMGNEAFRDGGGANGGVFYACTFRDNRAWNDSGGVDDAVLYNSLLTGNSLVGGSWGCGGGASESVLFGCVVTGNSATNGFGNNSGGGVSLSTLNNCTLVGNWAGDGGGASRSTLNNCIVYHNRAGTSGANFNGSTLNYCCTTPLPAGPGNLVDEPSFVNTNGWGDLRFHSNSPCINAGNNGYAFSATDLDGNPRIVGGTVDMGAYEFQSPASQLSYAWLQQYGLPTDGTADFADSDGDLMNNWQEWQCATVPTDALSALRLLTPQTDGVNLVVTWQSVTNRTYFLERSTSLGANASFLPLATNIIGQAGTTIFTDTNAAVAGQRFYRVGVQ